MYTCNGYLAQPMKTIISSQQIFLHGFGKMFGSLVSVSAPQPNDFQFTLSNICFFSFFLLFCCLLG
eukprot:m.232260 g.232260  ORF g.232260 m.232260 type:complete len:66 (-) comp17075_c2_seq1:1411-1608(-)